MQLGIGSYAYAWALGVPGFKYQPTLDAFQLIGQAAKLGVRVLQLADNVSFESFSLSEIRSLQQTAEHHGISLEIGTRGIAAEHLRKLIGIGIELKSPVLRVVTDSQDEEPSPDEIVCEIHKVLPNLAQSGIVLAIENHDRFTAEQLACIVRRIDSRSVGICLDTANSFGALEGPDVVVRTLAEFAVSLHIKDIVVRRASHGMGFVITGAPAGRGQLDIPWVLKSIREAGRDPNAILELWLPLQDTIAATIEEEERWRRESIAYLRGLVPT